MHLYKKLKVVEFVTFSLFLLLKLDESKCQIHQPSLKSKPKPGITGLARKNN